MKLTHLLAAAALVFAGPALAQPESYYQDAWCDLVEGETEVSLFDMTRVDCLTDQFAMEMDFARKWAESIGQARYYAEITGKEPAVVLIVAPGESRFLARFHNAAPDIRLYVMETVDE